MIEAVDSLAFLITIAGVVVALLFALRGRWKQGLVAGLELWVAAGLLRLGFDPEYHRIAAAAAIIATRKLVIFGLKTSPVWSTG